MKRKALKMSVLNKIATVFGVTIAAATLSLSAQAVPFTYTYTGNQYEAGSGEHDLLVLRQITGEFTVDLTPDNIDAPAADYKSAIISASFTADEGIRILTEVDIVRFEFSTDLNGNINIDNTLDILLEGPDTLLSGFPLTIGIQFEGTPSFGVPATGDFTFGPDGETSAFSDTVGTFAQVSAIPEPGALALFGAGLVGFGFLRRKRREKLGH